MYTDGWSTIKLDNRLRGDVMSLHHKCESHWMKKKKKKDVVMCTTKVYCDDGQVLFMDVSLHSMCHSLSVGTGNGVDTSIITGAALKDKVRHSL